MPNLTKSLAWLLATHLGRDSLQLEDVDLEFATPALLHAREPVHLGTVPRVFAHLGRAGRVPRGRAGVY